MSKFLTFGPTWEYHYGLGNCCTNATIQLNEWLEEHPNAEVIDWKAFAVGTGTDYYITIQYKEAN